MHTTADLIIGESSAEGLDLSSLTAIVHDALDVIQPGERVLAIIPDKTRDDNTHLLFPVATEFLTRRGVASFDALVAQGTHPPMSESQKLSKIGSIHFSGNLFDHRWDQPDELVRLGHGTTVVRGAARARWPSWSSKPVRPCSPRLGRFDSGAAPSN